MMEWKKNGAKGPAVVGRPVEGAVGKRKRAAHGRGDPAPDPELVERPRRRTIPARLRTSQVSISTSEIHPTDRRAEGRQGVEEFNPDAPLASFRSSMARSRLESLWCPISDSIQGFEM